MGSQLWRKSAICVGKSETCSTCPVFRIDSKNWRQPDFSTTFMSCYGVSRNISYVYQKRNVAQRSATLRFCPQGEKDVGNHQKIQP